jgi:hypothetical protein
MPESEVLVIVEHPEDILRRPVDDNAAGDLDFRTHRKPNREGNDDDQQKGQTDDERPAHKDPHRPTFYPENSAAPA